MAKPANAQTNPKPSVPEFTVQYVDHSYSIPANTTIDPFTGKTVTIPAQYINNQTIEISIKNQIKNTPYQQITDQPYLYYEIQMKGHFSQDWTNISFIEATPQAEYTILACAIDGNNASGQFTGRLNQLSSGGTADFQVQAQIWQYGTIPNSVYGTLFGLVSQSDWSLTHSVTVPQSSISPSPAVPEFPTLTILPLFAFVFFIAVKFRSKNH
jgi:hypothetical protein